MLTYGISSFVAHNDIDPTQEWQNEIELALKTCHGMLVLLHPKFHQSEWTDQEIGYAMARNLLVVPVRYGTDPYGFIGRFQAMEGAKKTCADLAGELFDILNRHTKTRKDISEAVVELFTHSDSFASARQNMTLLETLTYWNASLSEKVRSALKTNPQISENWTVPERLNSFLEQWRKTS